VQHVIRRDLVEVVCELGAIGIRNRVNYDVDLLQLRLVLRIGQQQFRQLEDVAGGRHFVCMLPG
jgi:hypothetical protein